MIDAEVTRELETIAIRNDCELVHSTFAGGVLSLILDREDGITLSQCEAVSRDASAYLDVVDFGSGKYTLEVGSPGLDRELYNERDYERFAGSLIKVTWTDDGRRRTDEALLVSLNGNRDGKKLVTVELPDGPRDLEFESIIKTRLVPQF